ncbi:serine hydrolase [Lactiplantibacillus sp. DA1]|uniref:serine hydrolase n=1 Tax=Lactiplantibacillus sp. DA1 TaxID=3079857 RepID=UPI00292A5FFB|nr:serine hydrolase [Lactiplantibacillus sp. DA1]MDV0430510.1 serine hydrolase [Lactiplantibacillus sp. DA1]
MKICPNCHHENASDVNFCENCGTKLLVNPNRCPRCQYLNPSHNRFWENCGYDFSTVAASSEAEVKKPLGQVQPAGHDQPAESESQPIQQRQSAPSIRSEQPSTPTQSSKQNQQSSLPHQNQSTHSTSAFTPRPALTTQERPVAQAGKTSTVAKPVQNADSSIDSDQAPKSGRHDQSTVGQKVAATKLPAPTQPSVNSDTANHQLDQSNQEPPLADESPAQVRAAGNPDTRANQATVRSPKKSKWPWLVAVLILIAAISGAAYFLYAQPSSNATTRSTATHKSTTQRSSSTAKKKAKSASKPVAVSFDTTQIKADISATVGAISGTNSVYVSPVDSHATVLVNNESQRSASSIKIFIMVTAYAMAKEGVFNLDDTHTIADSEKVGGTGVIQNMDAGTKLSYQEIIEHMIDDSDNTAANIMIEKLGGFQLINNKIKSMGATDTKLRRKMMDTKALDSGRDNTTSARDMGTTLKKIYNHQLVSQQADSAMLTILANNQNHTKLPKRLPDAATVYNKTGEYADYGVQNDAEIVKNQRGAFVAVVLSENGEETDQVDAMNRLGLMLYQNILE